MRNEGRGGYLPALEAFGGCRLLPCPRGQLDQRLDQRPELAGLLLESRGERRFRGRKGQRHGRRRRRGREGGNGAGAGDDGHHGKLCAGNVPSGPKLPHSPGAGRARLRHLARAAAPGTHLRRGRVGEGATRRPRGGAEETGPGHARGRRSFGRRRISWRFVGPRRRGPCDDQTAAGAVVEVPRGHGPQAEPPVRRVGDHGDHPRGDPHAHRGRRHQAAHHRIRLRHVHWEPCGAQGRGGQARGALGVRKQHYLPPR
mmetsp:Transcript_65717/g.148290  ORF Transcript_65717/g.148290 Transcript_65717/m.148290 type:complete len:257 (+) Transcript_65717:1104-1874(+)